MSRDNMKLSLESGSGSNAGAPTLTTPTLTPTTLRNIEQMFADRDPHEPPPHHVNAAGFVPPIISPSASNGYLSLVSAITTPSSEVAGVSLPDLVSPSLAELLPDLTNGHAKLTPTKPPPLIPKSSTSLTLASPSLPAIVEKLISWPPGGLQKPSSGSEKAKADLTISLRPPISFEKKERPPSLPIGPLTNGNVINKKMERLDSILKSVANSSLKANSVSDNSDNSGNSSNSCNSNSSNEGNASSLSSSSSSAEIEEKVAPVPALIISRSGSFSAVSSEVKSEIQAPLGGGNEDDRKKQRRERNKQAAARCRKRRLDLTCALQGEVDQWEDKVKSQKEELSQLETEKRGLEAILKKHAGICKIVKSKGIDN